MTDQLYFLLRKNPMGEIRTNGQAVPRDEAIEDAKNMRAGQLLEPGMNFLLQPINPYELEL
ncbi:MAG: hypothetical protein AAF251_06290 [Pseudomonadota bacterium]